MFSRGTGIGIDRAHYRTCATWLGPTIAGARKQFVERGVLDHGTWSQNLAIT